MIRASRLWLPALAVLAVAVGCATPVANPPLSFIEDDYAAAVAEARERDVPLFIESWAPW